MSLADHITSLNIQSSLESISDRCSVSLFFAPTDAGFSTIPAKNSEFTATVTVNDSATLSFLGIVKEREFSKSKDGYLVTLHLYDRGTYLLDANFDSKYKMTIIPEVDCDNPQITNTVDIVQEARELVNTAAGQTISLLWSVPHYNVMVPLLLRASVASILQELSSYFSLSEIQKVVLYSDDTGGIVCKILDLWESRMSGAVSLMDKNIVQLTIGETPLPGIRKARITGGGKHKMIWSSSQPSSVSQLSSDEYGRKTEVLTVTTFDYLGRVSSVVIDTSMEDWPQWGRLLMTRESIEYIYDPCSHRLIEENSITMQWFYSGFLTSSPNSQSWDSLRARTEYKYMTIKLGDVEEIDPVRLSNQVTTTEERILGSGFVGAQPIVLKKVTRDITKYMELAKGLTQRRSEHWQRGPLGTDIDKLKLISTTTDVFYGEPPGPLFSPPGPSQKEELSTHNAIINSGTVGFFFDFSNPNIIDEEGISGPFGKGAFANLVSQLKELSGATRLDIAVSLVGFPFIKKGDIISVEDVRKPRAVGETPQVIKAAVMEVNHSVTIGSEYVTSIRAVSYQ